MSDRTETFYAAEGGFIGYGAQLLVGAGDSPETFEAVFGVESITFPKTEFSDTDTTHLRSPNRHHEHRAGMRDTSEITITGIYNPSEQSLSSAGGGTGPFQGGGLPVLAEDGNNRNFIVRLPIGSPAVELPIRGYIKGFSLNDLNTEDVVKYSLSLMPTQAFQLP